MTTYVNIPPNYLIASFDLASALLACNALQALRDCTKTSRNRYVDTQKSRYFGLPEFMPVRV